MVKQYPHTLEVFTTSDESYQDDNGDWIVPEGEWETVGKCRDQPNSKGETVYGEDGQAFLYQSIIYMSKKRVNVSNRDKIRVIDEVGSVRLESIVKRISFDQLHTRIWV